jgi:hypothetical protein
MDTRTTLTDASPKPGAVSGREPRIPRRPLRLYSDLNGNYSRDYFGLVPNGDEIPAYNVFSRQAGTIRHFWSGEMIGDSADPGQDPRRARPRAAVELPGHDAGRAGRGLVSEPGVQVGG